MDYLTLIARVGDQIRQKRLHRGLTQIELANIAGLTRQKVIGVEKGSRTCAISAYARALAALDCELTVVPATMPTLEEIGDLFK